MIQINQVLPLAFRFVDDDAHTGNIVKYKYIANDTVHVLTPGVTMYVPSTDYMANMIVCIDIVCKNRCHNCKTFCTTFNITKSIYNKRCDITFTDMSVNVAEECTYTVYVYYTLSVILSEGIEYNLISLHTEGGH
jgi:hypothetical protein